MEYAVDSITVNSNSKAPKQRVRESLKSIRRLIRQVDMRVVWLGVSVTGPLVTVG